MSLIPSFAETTKRQASIEIVNKSGRNLISVAVAHKYSDNYKDRCTWKMINNGEASSTRTVRYNTGNFTTGRDWWIVICVDDRGDVYITDPNNFRAPLDILEKLGKGIASSIAKIATYISFEDPEPSTQLVAACVAVTSTIVDKCLNTESTSGYKQHILREEDEDSSTKIVIKNNEVEFNSKSGTSRTRFTKISK